jgi:hypothetical protein
VSRIAIVTVGALESNIAVSRDAIVPVGVQCKVWGQRKNSILMKNVEYFL